MKRKEEKASLDIATFLADLGLATPKDTASAFRVGGDAYLIGAAILMLAQEVRLMREDVKLIHGVIDECSTALETSIDRLANVTEGT